MLRIHKSPAFRPAIFIFLFASMAFVVWRTFAAGADVRAEPETGTVSGGAAVINDAGASGGKALRFSGSGATAPDPKPAASFTFAAAGDFAMGSQGTGVIKKIGASNVNFFLNLGDMRYSSSDSTPEPEWCQWVKNNLNAGAGKPAGDSYGENFPVPIIGGNHEDGVTHTDGGVLDRYAACLPDRMNSVQSPNLGTNNTTATKNYGKEYYFDYPSGAASTRFILISPYINHKYGGLYEYLKGNARYNWVSSTIDDARAKGIKWVIVGMHRNCISTGAKSCEIKSDLMNLMVSKKVDLVLQGHDHNFQRTKQLGLNSSTCTALAINSYDADCVVDGSTDMVYTKGAGTKVVISGLGGVTTYGISSSDSEAGYFARIHNGSYGFVKINVTDTSLTGNWVTGYGTSSFSDSFTIQGTGGATPTPTPTPTPGACAPAPTTVPYGSAAMGVSAPAGGNYRVWSRVRQSAGSGNAYALVIGNCSYKVGDSATPLGQWTWVNYQNASASNLITANLAAGQHSVKFLGIEPGLEVDRVIMTTDLACVPTGMGDNCLASPSPSASVSPTPGTKAGDLNGDGIVNVFDLSVLLARWGTADAAADITRDGTVNVFDLSMLLTNWTR